MICVDTSVWVAAFRNQNSESTRVLQDLLDADQVALPAPVRLELLTGASKQNRVKLRRALSAVPLLFPAQPEWDRLDRWVDQAGDAGEQFGIADLLIAAIAAEAGAGAAVWSLDTDFTRMARLRFVQLYRAPT